MPTYFRSGNVLVQLYNGDHNPPHVHIVAPSGNSAILLSDLSTLRGDVSRHDYELAMGWIRANIEYLRSEWDRLNG